ncbi:hypothetical protein, partial [Flavobacterium hibisci]|uniref:hypothetical protein n=1 Tax=Flavobacterium hibisci TaxID=1914462 RepID=UPI001CBA7A3A
TISFFLLTKFPKTLFSPDRRGNPFAFFFKKQKIEADSGNKLLDYYSRDSKVSTPLSPTNSTYISQ